MAPVTGKVCSRAAAARIANRRSASAPKARSASGPSLPASAKPLIELTWLARPRDTGEKASADATVNGVGDMQGAQPGSNNKERKQKKSKRAKGAFSERSLSAHERRAAARAHLALAPCNTGEKAASEAAPGLESGDDGASVQDKPEVDATDNASGKQGVRPRHFVWALHCS